MLSKQALKEFKEIWKKKYGKETSDEFAMEQAINLLTLFGSIYRPLKKEWLEDYELREAQNNKLAKQMKYGFRTNRKISGKEKAS